MEEDGRCCVACMDRRADGCRRNPAAYMPWRPGGCTTECDELCFTECRPADMEPVNWE
jgi:hypothetical protein